MPNVHTTNTPLLDHVLVGGDVTGLLSVGDLATWFRWFYYGLRIGRVAIIDLVNMRFAFEKCQRVFMDFGDSDDGRVGLFLSKFKKCRKSFFFCF